MQENQCLSTKTSQAAKMTDLQIKSSSYSILKALQVLQIKVSC